MSFKSQVQALYTALVADIPVILWGPPGTGKTATLTHLARKLGWHLEVVIGATRDRTDFGGFPVARETGVELHPLPWVKRLLQAGRESILFLDELSSTPEDVRPALLRVINERQAGDHPIPSRIVAAANPAEQAVGGFDLEPPLANRLVHLEWSLTPQEWATGIREGWETIYPDLPPPPPEEHLRTHQTHALDLVALFLERNPSAAYRLPQDENRGKAWPSYRTWHMAGILHGTAKALGFREEVASLLISGAVGREGFSYLAFVRDLDLPDPKEVIRNPSLLPSRDDRLYATLMAVASLATGEWTEALWRGAWKVIGYAAEGGKADLAVPAAGRLIRAHMQARENRRPTWTFPEEAKRFLPLVQKVAELR